MDNQRLEATHFIEVRNLEVIGAGNYGPLLSIDLLRDTLNNSRVCYVKTIAIWKIKFKKP